MSWSSSKLEWWAFGPTASTSSTAHSWRPKCRQYQAPVISKNCQSNHKISSQYKVQSILKLFLVNHKVVGCLKITEDKISNTKLMSTWGLHFNSSANITIHQQRNTMVAFCAKRDGHVALQNTDLKVIFQHQNASLSTLLSNFNASLWISCFSTDTSMWAPHLNIRARFASNARPVFLL